MTLSDTQVTPVLYQQLAIPWNCPLNLKRCLLDYQNGRDTHLIKVWIAIATSSTILGYPHWKMKCYLFSWVGTTRFSLILQKNLKSCNESLQSNHTLLVFHLNSCGLWVCAVVKADAIPNLMSQHCSSFISNSACNLREEILMSNQQPSTLQPCVIAKTSKDTVKLHNTLISPCRIAITSLCQSFEWHSRPYLQAVSSWFQLESYHPITLSLTIQDNCQSG